MIRQLRRKLALIAMLFVTAFAGIGALGAPAPAAAAPAPLSVYLHCESSGGGFFFCDGFGSGGAGGYTYTWQGVTNATIHSVYPGGANGACGIGARSYVKLTVKDRVGTVASKTTNFPCYAFQP